MRVRPPSSGNPHVDAHTWVCVMAGGEGRRLEEVARARYGYARPKQYCDFGAGRTLLDETLDRARLLVPDERIVVVTTRAHRVFADECLLSHPRVHWVEQPSNRDTTPGILLPLLYVLDQDPIARVVVMPSDHSISQERAFAALVHDAIDSLGVLDSDVLVLGAPAAGVDDGYGWIVPQSRPRERWARVASFREKPSKHERHALAARGALRNTLVLVGYAVEIAAMIAEHAPTWHDAMQGAFHTGTLESVYETLPSANFSHDVLERCTDRLRVVPLGEVGWDDIGTPERLARAYASEPDVAAGAAASPAPGGG